MRSQIFGKFFLGMVGDEKGKEMEEEWRDLSVVFTINFRFSDEKLASLTPRLMYNVIN